MGGIFVSYRREDSRHAAGRLVDRLVAALGRDRLFMDVDSIEPGADFAKVLDEQVANCDVLLALIGQHWLEARDALGRRRIDDPGDFVRIEIESALARKIRVIPVLLDGADLPALEALPESLRPLLRRQALRMTHERFAQEADALAASLKKGIDQQGFNPAAARAPANATGAGAFLERPVAAAGSRDVIAAVLMGLGGAVAGGMAYGSLSYLTIDLAGKPIAYTPALLTALLTGAGLLLWGGASWQRAAVASLIAGALWFGADLAGTLYLTDEPTNRTSLAQLLVWSAASSLAPLAAIWLAYPRAMQAAPGIAAVVTGTVCGLAFYVGSDGMGILPLSAAGAVAIGPLMAVAGYMISSAARQ